MAFEKPVQGLTAWGAWNPDKWNAVAGAGNCMLYVREVWAWALQFPGHLLPNRGQECGFPAVH